MANGDAPAGARRVDLTLIVILITLTGIGLGVLLSASHYYAERVFGDSLYFVRRQALFIVIGTIAAVVASRVNSQVLKRLSIPLLALSAVLMTLTLIPGISTPIQGARRWLLVAGISYEPSELVKFTLVLYLASMLSRKYEARTDAVNTLLPPVIVVCVFAALIYLQNDFSTAALLMLVTGIIFFVARVQFRYFVALASVGIPLAVIMIFTRVHRVERVIAFFNPEADPTGSGYQVLAARQALTSGGLTGLGLGQGVRKLGEVPEIHSDFVFAVVGEETGLIGVVIVLALFVAFASRGYRIAGMAQDRFEAYLACGVTTSVTVQAFANIAVVAGLLPATGIPLPLFSSGGSAMVMTLTMAGVLCGISRRTVGGASFATDAGRSSRLRPMGARGA